MEGYTGMGDPMQSVASTSRWAHCVPLAKAMDSVLGAAPATLGPSPLHELFCGLTRVGFSKLLQKFQLLDARLHKPLFQECR